MKRVVWLAPALLLLTFGIGGVRPLSAQEEAPLFLSRSDEDGRLRLRVGSLFDDVELTQALHSGLPMRIQIVAELWKDGFFDSQRGRADWRASVVFDPLERTYLVTGSTTPPSDTVVSVLDDVAMALEDLFALPLSPREDGRFYYLGEIAIETLSLSDLEELQRWLRGDLSTDQQDDRERETAMGRGVRRLLVRVLGLPSRKLKFRSPTFEIRGGPPG